MGKVFQPTIGTSTGGTNQARLRAHNERLILSIIQRHGKIAKSELAKHAGLTPQAVTIIIRALESDGLLLRGEPRRGKVGQPSIPMSLNPNGAYSIGLKIGRRRADLILMGFTGQQVALLHKVYPYPEPGKILEFIRTGLNPLLENLPAPERQKIVGIGVAMPFSLWDWADKIAAPAGTMDAWRGFDIKHEIEKLSDFPVLIENDATSACGAELVYGRSSNIADFIYFFIGSFIGGGIVLNHAVYRGKSGNAGAIAPMPVIGPDGRASQLLEHASIYVLEKQLREKGIDPSPLWLSPDNWDEFDDLVFEWAAVVAKNLALAILASCSVIDFDAAIIDGSIPEKIRGKIVDLTRHELAQLDMQGIDPPLVEMGTTANDARVMGSASLPLFARYFLDKNTI